MITLYDIWVKTAQWFLIKRRTSQSKMSHLGLKAKGQLDLKYLYKRNALLGSTLLAGIMISALTVIEKWIFPDFSI